MRKTRNIIAEEKHLAQGQASEKEGSWTEAIKHYTAVLKKNPAHILANSRLMIIYRKLKEHQKELEIINKAIISLRQHIEETQMAWINEHSGIAKSTEALAKSLDLLTSSGLPRYQNEFVDKWEKRKLMLLKRLQAKKSKTKIKS